MSRSDGPMRVIKVHNHYQRPGGEDDSFAAECELLAGRGHELLQVTAHNDELDDMSRVRAAWETCWNANRARQMKELIADFAPDIVHFDNTFLRLSPAVVAAASDAGAAVVQSLRNYRLVCANALLLRDGRVCEDCVGKAVPWPGVFHGCYRGSRPASAVVAGMLMLHRARGTWQRDVHAYIALTDFVRDKLAGAGLPADRIHVKPNFLRADPGTGAERDGSVLFVGRLAEEKGVHVLLEAWRRHLPQATLRVVGDGPLANLVEAAAGERENVRWLGHQPRARVLELLGRAELLVVPSIWQEPFGRVVIEAFARGTPVVASDLGGLGQLVEDGRAGRLVPPGDPGALARAVRELLGAPQRRRAMGEHARRTYEEHYTAGANYDRLMQIYEAARKERDRQAWRKGGRQGSSARP